MVTRQGRRRVSKRREEREFVESLEKARDTLDRTIAQAERNSALTLDTLEQFSDEMGEIYDVARRMESDS